MTATIPDAALILRREDERLARRAGDDPLPAETITALADAVRRQIIDPILADTTPDAPANTEPEPSTEPWRDLFGRIRAELGLTSDRTDT